MSATLSYELRTKTARVGGREIVGVERCRTRAYPGLASEAPATSVLYEEAARVLRAGAVHTVWDVGAGAGVGASVLAESFARVIAIDPSAPARDFASAMAPELCVRPSMREALAPPDAAVIVDVLGHADAPLAVLRELRKYMKLGARALVAEQAAHALQVLRAPMRRAFTKETLSSLAAAAGFEVESWVVSEGTFLACVLVATPDEGTALLELGANALSKGDDLAALAAYAEAKACDDARVAFEASLGEADVRLARGEGDLACAAYLAAIARNPRDPRAASSLAQLLCDAGERTTAARLAEQASRCAPSEACAAVAMAVVTDALFAGSGVTGEPSLDAWRRAASLAPDHPVVVCHYASCSLRAGDPTSALLSLERLRAYGDPLPAVVHVALGEVLLALGRKADAHAEVKMALAKAPAAPEVMDLWKRVHGKA